MMDPDEVRSLIEHLQSISLDMDADTLDSVHRACEVIEKMSSEQVRRVISLAGGRPCLQTFMSDGWSTDIRKRSVASHDNVSVHSRTRLREEFVMQRSIVKTLVGSDVHMAIKFERPRQLGSKKCLDVWAAACDFVPVLRLAGHTGISLAVYMQNGLFSKPFGQMMKARHGLFFDKLHCPIEYESDADREIDELKDWIFTWTCCAHACSRALKWGMMHIVAGCGDLLEEVHISISALLRASTGLYMCVDEFIAGYVAFDRHEPDNMAELEYLWVFLDVAPTDLALFMKVNPLWEGQKLRVNASLLADGDCVKAITTVLHYCLKWCDFSDTRWTKVGLCGRLYIRSVLVGVEGLVDLAMKNDAVCKWHLNGYKKKCSPAVRRYLGVAAASGRPSECFLLELLEDDRFLLHADRMWQTVCDEHRYLLSAPSSFYECISAALGLDVQVYRSDVLKASLTSMAYLHMDCWVPLTLPPLCYVMGDVQANVDALKDESDVREATSLKIQTWALLGHESDVVSALLLLRQTSLTTTLVEQAHASGAQLMNRHESLEYVNLLCRMTVHNCRGLFYMCPYERQLLRLNGLLAKLDKQMQHAHKAGPREQYVKMLIAAVKRSRGPGGPSDHSVRRSIFKHHAEQYDKLGPGQVAVLRHKALVGVAKKLETLAESREHVLGQLSLLRSRHEQEKANGLVNHVASVRYGQAELLRFAALWKECDGSDAARLKPPPNVGSPGSLKILSDQMDRQKQTKPQKPDWLAHLISHRDVFAGCGFISGADSSGRVVYLLCLAIGQPQRVEFLECTRCSLSPGNLWHSLQDFQDACATRNRYEYSSFRFVDASNVPWATKDNLWVIPQMVLQDRYVYAIGEPVLWSTFTRFHGSGAAPPKKPDADQRLRRSGGPIKEELPLLLQREFPWLSLEQLLELLNSKLKADVPPHPSGHGPSSGSSSSGSASSRPAGMDVPEDVAAALHSELSALRAELDAEDEPSKHFKVRALGGVWSQRLFGKAVTDVGAYARDKTIKTWCAAVGWPEARSFAVQKYSGIRNCRMLAEEVARKGNYYLAAWEAAGSPQPWNFDHLRVGYSSTRAYDLWFDDLPLNSESSLAAFAIRDMCPRPLPP